MPKRKRTITKKKVSRMTKTPKRKHVSSKPMVRVVDVDDPSDKIPAGKLFRDAKRVKANNLYTMSDSHRANPYGVMDRLVLVVAKNKDQAAKALIRRIKHDFDKDELEEMFGKTPTLTQVKRAVKNYKDNY